MTTDRVEERPEKEEGVELSLYTTGGRVYLLSDEGEWVDVTDKWAGREKEN